MQMIWQANITCKGQGKNLEYTKIDCSTDLEPTKEIL